MLAQAEKLTINWLDYLLSDNNKTAGRYFFGHGCGLCAQPGMGCQDQHGIGPTCWRRLETQVEKSSPLGGHFRYMTGAVTPLWGRDDGSEGLTGPGA